DAAVPRVVPRWYGGGAEPSAREGALFIEVPPDLSRPDAAGATGDWPPAAIDEALQAAAGWHAAFWGIDSARIAWAGPRLGTPDMVADVPLWRGLLDDARRRFPEPVTGQIWRRRHRLVATLAGWPWVKA